jgi:hypothetical protein
MITVCKCDARVDEVSIFQALVPIYKFIRSHFSEGLNINYRRSKNLVCSREHLCIFRAVINSKYENMIIHCLFLIV